MAHKPGRFEHYLKPLKRVRLPQRLLFLDCEAFEEAVSDTEKIQKFRLAVTVFRDLSARKTEKREVRVWKDRFMLSQYIHSLVKKKDTLYMFAHNLFYDVKLAGILKLLQSRFGWTVQRFLNSAGSLIFILSHQKKRSRIVMLDTLNYFQCTVEDLGKVIGLPKLDVDVFTADEKTIIEYCRRDVEIIEKAVLDLLGFCAVERIPLQYTIGGLSMSAFRAKFQRKPIHIHADPVLDDFERQAYYGGRTECFYLGEIEECYKLDVNSMYPAVMKNPVPVRVIDRRESYHPEALLDMLRDGKLAIAEVYIETEEPAFPYRKDRKLFFPIGRYWTTLCTPELRYALERGYVKKVRGVVFYIGVPIFTEFVDYFYRMKREMKQKANHIYEFLYKRILNALYGKWAQLKREVVAEWEGEVEDWRKEEVFYEDRAFTEVRIGRKVFLVEKTEKPAFHSFIAISAHITSYARIYLWNLIRTAGRENVYYCDTDSLFVTREGYERLKPYVDEHALGLLRLEGVGRCVIYGLKDYVFEDRRKKKGIPRNAWFMNSEYYFWRFEKFAGSLQKALNDDYVHLFLEKRKPSQKYEKGIVLPDGRIEPIRIEE